MLRGAPRKVALAAQRVSARRSSAHDAASRVRRVHQRAFRRTPSAITQNARRLRRRDILRARPGRLRKHTSQPDVAVQTAHLLGALARPSLEAVLGVGAQRGVRVVRLRGFADQASQHFLMPLRQRRVEVRGVLEREFAQALPLGGAQPARAGFDVVQVLGVHHRGVPEEILENRLRDARVLPHQVDRAVRHPEHGVVVRVHGGEQTSLLVRRQVFDIVFDVVPSAARRERLREAFRGDRSGQRRVRRARVKAIKYVSRRECACFVLDVVFRDDRGVVLAFGAARDSSDDAAH